MRTFRNKRRTRKWSVIDRIAATAADTRGRACDGARVWNSFLGATASAAASVSALTKPGRTCRRRTAKRKKEGPRSRSEHRIGPARQAYSAEYRRRWSGRRRRACGRAIAVTFISISFTVCSLLHLRAARLPASCTVPMSFPLSLCPSVCVSIHPSSRPSVRLSDWPPTHLAGSRASPCRLCAGFTLHVAKLATYESFDLLSSRHRPAD